MPVLNRPCERTSGRFVYENNRLMDIIPRRVWREMRQKQEPTDTVAVARPNPSEPRT